MRVTPEEKSKVFQKLDWEANENYWILPENLFGGETWDIHDFNMKDYTYFLDNVKTLENLLEGLDVLSPFADDALKVARDMNYQDFYEFKLTLAHERRQEDSKIPKRYFPLVIPKWFIYAFPVAEKFNTSLGMTMIRLIEANEHV